MFNVDNSDYNFEKTTFSISDYSSIYPRIKKIHKGLSVHKKNPLKFVDIFNSSIISNKNWGKSENKNYDNVHNFSYNRRNLNKEYCVFKIRERKKICTNNISNLKL